MKTFLWIIIACLLIGSAAYFLKPSDEAVKKEAVVHANELTGSTSQLLGWSERVLENIVRVEDNWLYQDIYISKRKIGSTYFGIYVWKN